MPGDCKSQGTGKAKGRRKQGNVKRKMTVEKARERGKQEFEESKNLGKAKI